MGSFQALLVILSISSTLQIKLDNISNFNSFKLTLLPSKIIGESLKTVLERDGQADIMITMENSTEIILDSISSKKFDTRSNLVFNVYDALNNHADISQRHIKTFLDSRNIEHKSFWVTNMIYIENATTDTVNNILSMSGISTINLEEVYPVPEPVELEEVAPQDLLGEKKEFELWNMKTLGMDCAWKLCNGTGAVVANIDTGVNYNHTYLKTNFRKEIGWYDPYNHTSQYQHTYPNDKNGHGTHTMGTIAGSKGIGVAPGAKWIACKGCESRGCKQNCLISCGEWLLCPRQKFYNQGTGTTAPDRPCEGAPDVINNSWGGGQGTTWFEGVTKAWQICGIIPVFSQGNSGPKCGTANSPGDMLTVIGVGATDSLNGIAKFSSKGPTVDGHMKPDISAPGHKILSCYKKNDTSMATASGTSMSAPHVTGVVALLVCKGVCKHHLLKHGSVNGKEYYQCIYKALTSYACTKNYIKSKTCNDTSEDSVPNYSFGYGILNACNSLSAIKDKACIQN